ncbi:MAG: hypothetical protein KC435_14860 [Thermomicrobiales bacterium]|nr:hypothetical protein [Thermomicrobiales bacterium]
MSNEDENKTADDNAALPYYVAGIGIAFLLVVSGTAISGCHDAPDSIVLSTGVSAFALLYAATQSIERVVELTIEVVNASTKLLSSGRLGIKRENIKFAENQKRESITKLQAARFELRLAMNAGVDEPPAPTGPGTPSTPVANPPAPDAPEDDVRKPTSQIDTAKAEVANAQAELKKSRSELAVLSAWWSFGLSFLALSWLEVGIFELLLVKNESNPVVPGWLDWLLTAAVMSGGAKGLHDLISKIEKSKSKDESS